MRNWTGHALQEETTPLQERDKVTTHTTILFRQAHKDTIHPTELRGVLHKNI